MKRFLPAATSILLTAVICACAARASEVRVTYRFDSPRIEPAGGGFSRLVFPATVQAGPRGEPSLPFRGAAVLLPPGESVAAVRLERRRWTAIGEAVRLYPRQDPVPALDLPIDAGERPPLIREEVYAADRWISPPDGRFRTQYLCGHPVAAGAFSPAACNPGTGEAGWYAEIEIVIETAASSEAADARRLLRNDEKTLARLASLVDNPERVEAIPADPRRAPAAVQYDLAIITREIHLDEFTALAEYYERRGVRTIVSPVEEIEPAYPGLDTQDDIRRHIEFLYTAHGITHVLLAGDSDGGLSDVPHRGLYRAVQSSGLYEDEGIPADLYYAALDGNWNGDGDSRWGEPGEDDLYAEVAIGRAPIDSPAEIAAFIAKTIAYQQTPVASQCRSALLLGEKLYENPLTWGGDEMDQLIGMCDAHGFATTGLPPGFDIAKYYDRDLGSWSKESVFAEVSAGVHWLFHSGHSNYNYVMRMVSGDVNATNFTNDGIGATFPIVYTYGCIAGGFDYNDCIGEAIVSGQTFASAFIGNSRYGWFTEGTTNGPSHHFQREFLDAVFGEGITTLGEANGRSKDETVPFVDLPDEYEPGAHRWCFYCLNLLGDPMMDAWTDTPTAMSVSHGGTIDRGDTALAVSTGTPGARGALSYGGDCLGTALADGAGGILIVLARAIPQETDSLDLVVTVHNRLPYEARIAVTDLTGSGPRAPRLALFQNVPNPFNPATTIRFTAARPGPVDLRVYDVAGREVARLVDGHRDAGAHEVLWRAEGIAGGVYFYVLRAGGRTISRKAVLLR
ncbi:MAG: C25 family cysteine peptidase [Candidatus Krumholzibacteria bacterium]|nr:C25 family cysteine peptidase [Candidatus Krumholzibacteria bacterium]